jgi:L-serine deaminase
MISAFDMFSIGIGPSSSHTVGPMRASRLFVNELEEKNLLANVTDIKVELFGSLGQTGIGHGSGKAVILGLAGYDPETIDADLVDDILAKIEKEQVIYLNQSHKPISLSKVRLYSIVVKHYQSTQMRWKSLRVKMAKSYSVKCITQSAADLS